MPIFTVPAEFTADVEIRVTATAAAAATIADDFLTLSSRGTEPCAAVVAAGIVGGDAAH
jgi:hypothetical protein